MKYKIKNLVPIIIIATGMVASPACAKFERVEYTPPPQHHATFYEWGYDNWDKILPTKTDNVARSLDSALVDIVLLRNDGFSLQGMRTHDIFTNINSVIESVPTNKRDKLRGFGTLRETGIASSQDVTDSAKLAQFGFMFGRVRYGQFQR